MNSSKVEIVCFNCNPVIQAEPTLVCDVEYLKTVDGVLMLLKYRSYMQETYQICAGRKIYSDNLQIWIFVLQSLNNLVLLQKCPTMIKSSARKRCCFNNNIELRGDFLHCSFSWVIHVLPWQRRRPLFIPNSHTLNVRV